MGKLPTTVFEPKRTSIPGLIFFTIDNPSDDRGYFQEKFQKAKLVEAGMPEDFNVVQNSLTHNKQRGVVRGFHAEPWNKYVSVVKGKVFSAFIDLRSGPSFGNIETIEITPQTAVFLPKGVANSVQTLEDDTYYLYSVDAHWSADKYEEYCFVNLADPDIKVDWPIPMSESIANDRDKNHPMLKDVKPMEV